MREEVDITKFVERITRYENVYCDTVKQQMSRYPALENEFPPYLTQALRIQACIAGDGIVVSRFAASEFTITFVDEPDRTVREVTSFDEAIWRRFDTQMRQQRGNSGGQGFALQIRATGWPKDFQDTTRDTGQGAFLVSMMLTNTFDLSQWSAPLAQAEASSDVNTHVAALLMNLQSSIDINDASGTEHAVLVRFSSVVERFRDLLKTSQSEATLQAFLLDNPSLLALDVGRVLPQFRLGADYITDFVLELADQQYILVEIEAASHDLYTREKNPRKRKPTAALNTALQQIEDWQDWVQHNISYLSTHLPEINHPQYWLIIGRSPAQRRERRALAQKQHNLLPIQLFTYDDLLDRAARQLRNLAKY